MRNWIRSNTRRRAAQVGITLIEVMIAGAILTICALGVIGMIGTAIASNARNKHDSTKTMLAEAVAEQVSSTLIAGTNANLSDCAGTLYTINTTTDPTTGKGGAAVVGGVGSNIDFTEASPPSGYQMNYVVTSPCASGGQYVATYDVRWHIDLIGKSAGTPTNSFLLTVGARRLSAAASGPQSMLYFSPPINLVTVIGKTE